MRLDHLLSKEERGNRSRVSEKLRDYEDCSIFKVPMRKRDFERRKRGFSSAGRAPALQAGGQGFDSLNLHQPRTSVYDVEDNRSWADSSAG